MHLAVTARFDASSTLFEQDPNCFPDTASSSVQSAIMGDIVQTSSDKVHLDIEIASHAPIERVEVRNGLECVHLQRPYESRDLGSRIRVIWSGAEYRGARAPIHLDGASTLLGLRGSTDRKDQCLEPRAKTRKSWSRHRRMERHHDWEFWRLRRLDERGSNRAIATCKQSRRFRCRAQRHRTRRYRP